MMDRVDNICDRACMILCVAGFIWVVTSILL
jgi:hypothetical protein